MAAGAGGPGRSERARLVVLGGDAEPLADRHPPGAAAYTPAPLSASSRWVPGETPRGRGKEKARDNLVAVVIEALKAGERPTDVTAWSPFTAAYVRKIARAHGIEAPGHSRGEA